MEDFVFPASKLIVEARNGSGTCGPLKTFHVVHKERIFLCMVYLLVQRPQNEFNNSNLLVLLLFMFIRSSII